MTAIGIHGLTRAKPNRFETLNRNQLLHRQVTTRDRVIRIGRALPSARAIRVLVVADQREAGDELVRLTRRFGNSVRRADDGLAALRVAATQHPDVVFLDFDFPLMDGCQVARHLRHDFPGRNCLIIAVTARTDDVRRRECTKAGIDLLLVTPVNPEVVETLLMLECARVKRSQVA